MKKTFTILSTVALPILAMAQGLVQPSPVTSTPDNVKFMKNIQALKLSPSGEWVGSGAGDASVYNLITGEHIDYWGGTLGLGNPIANNGWAVGQTTGTYAVLMINGQVIRPQSLSSYWWSSIDGITPDASRVCGFVNNPNGKGMYMQYIPFVAELDENGELGEPQFLPYPDKFLFGDTPNRVTAIWISDDGKTVLGEIVSIIDALGVPVVYTQDDNGVWSCSMPSAGLYNPNGVVLPPDPEESGPAVPDFTQFMNPVEREAYMAAYENFVNSNYDPNLEPDPVRYMTQEEIDAYNAAVEEYEKWYDSSNVQEAYKEYNKAYTEIRQTSPFFKQNEMALSNDGKMLMQSATMINKELGVDEYIYSFALDGSGQIGKYNSPAPDTYPSCIAADGTAFIVGSIEDQIAPSTYVLEPGASDFTDFVDYIAPEYPEAADWIDLNFPTAVGAVQVNPDQTVFASALYYFNYMNWTGDEDFFYSSYFISNTIDFTGIESIVAEDQDGVYKVYNLQGLKVMETKEASDLNSLPKGLYIINGKKVMK